MPSETKVRQALLAMAGYATESLAICEAAADGRFSGHLDLRAICRISGISQSSSHRVEKALSAGVPAGAFERRTGLSWSTVPGFDYSSLALLLEGAAIYKAQVFEPDNQVKVVLTKPPSPSKLERALDAMGYRMAFIENTGEIFKDLAAQSHDQFIVMTPFLDEDGAMKLIQLFRQVPPEAHKRLIIRCPDKVPTPSLVSISDNLKQIGVQVFNYWLPKEQTGTYETFHAKVVLSNASKCYVGSANMTQASFAFSMELGFLVEGEAAKTVAWLCDAICRTAAACRP